MNFNCMNEKIANAQSRLKPIILRAILKIYQNGKNEISAQMVRNECSIIDNDINWNNRLPAICNIMRKTLDCGGRIKGEDRDFNNFTIFFGENIEGIFISEINNNSSIGKDKPKTVKKEIDSADQKIECLINKFDWKKIQDINVKKLLIIGCSDSKNLGGKQSNSINYFSNNEIYKTLIKCQDERLREYSRLLVVEPNYFLFKENEKLIKRNKKPILKDYFKDCLFQGLTMPAIERYSGKFYSDELKELYSEKNQNSNLHILIISGLYGVIEFRDSIIDYHLEMKKNPFWIKKKNSIVHDAISKYIRENNIDDEMVFYFV